MIGHIRNWGNSGSLRLPVRILRALNVDIDSRVELRVENGVLVVKPAPGQKSGLDALLDGITPENRHGEVSFGDDVGLESW